MARLGRSRRATVETRRDGVRAGSSSPTAGGVLLQHCVCLPESGKHSYCLPAAEGCGYPSLGVFHRAHEHHVEGLHEPLHGLQCHNADILRTEGDASCEHRPAVAAIDDVPAAEDIGHLNHIMFHVFHTDIYWKGRCFFPMNFIFPYRYWASRERTSGRDIFLMAFRRI